MPLPTDTLTIIGVMAASFTVLGVAVAAVKRIKKTIDSLGQRLGDMETAFQIKRRVRVTKKQLAVCPGLKGGVYPVDSGTIGELTSISGVIGTVRIENSTTEIMIPLTELVELEPQL